MTDGQGGQAVRVFSPHSYPKEFFSSTASSLLFQARAVHASPQDPALYSPVFPVPHPTFDREPPQPGRCCTHLGRVVQWDVNQRGISSSVEKYWDRVGEIKRKRKEESNT